VTGSEIDAIRALLGAKPRPVGWVERRHRIEEVCAAWPVADDIKLEAVDLGGGRPLRAAIRRGSCCSSTAAAIARARSSAIGAW
jgi:hypothetical protein